MVEVFGEKRKCLGSNMNVSWDKLFCWLGPKPKRRKLGKNEIHLRLGEADDLDELSPEEMRRLSLD